MISFPQTKDKNYRPYHTFCHQIKTIVGIEADKVQKIPGQYFCGPDSRYKVAGRLQLLFPCVSPQYDTLHDNGKDRYPVFLLHFLVQAA